MVPHQLPMLLFVEEPAHFAPMRFTPGGCCPCGVEQLHEIIMFYGTTVTNGQYDFYLNGVHLGQWIPNVDDDGCVFFADFTPFPRVVIQEGGNTIRPVHYAEPSDILGFEYQYRTIDPALYLPGENEFRIVGDVAVGSSNPGAHFVKLCIGPVRSTGILGPQYELLDGYSEWLVEELLIQNLHLGYDQTFTFTRPG